MYYFPALLVFSFSCRLQNNYVDTESTINEIVLRTDSFLSSFGIFFFFISVSAAQIFVIVVACVDFNAVSRAYTIVGC